LAIYIQKDTQEAPIHLEGHQVFFPLRDQYKSLRFKDNHASPSMESCVTLGSVWLS